MMADVGGLSIVASPSVILADGITYPLLTATVIQPNGDPLQGVPVTFAATSGTLSETEVTTDENGQASVRLVSSSVAGTSTVTVTCQTLSSQTQVQFATEGTNVLSLLYASVLPADGQTSSLLTAQLVDTQGGPLLWIKSSPSPHLSAH
jgi:adhesin/invasin